MTEFTAAGARVYVLSYDEADAQADYKAAHNANFTMLSDPNSDVIRSFGILNTPIPEDDHPWYGIPYPGVYITDAEGVITAKFFENNFTVRPGPEQLLAAVRGKEVLLKERSGAGARASIYITNPYPKGW